MSAAGIPLTYTAPHMSVAGPVRGDEHETDPKHRPPRGQGRVAVKGGALTSELLDPSL